MSFAARHTVEPQFHGHYLATPPHRTRCGYATQPTVMHWLEAALSCAEMLTSHAAQGRAPSHRLEAAPPRHASHYRALARSHATIERRAPSLLPLVQRWPEVACPPAAPLPIRTMLAHRQTRTTGSHHVRPSPRSPPHGVHEPHRCMHVAHLPRAPTSALHAAASRAHPIGHGRRRKRGAETLAPQPFISAKWVEWAEWAKFSPALATL